jgi:hypothetical protein
MALDPKSKIYEFDIDFNRMVVIPTHIGRIHFEDGSSIRLYFGPKGMMALIYKAQGSKQILIQEQDDNTELAVLST